MPKHDPLVPAQNFPSTKPVVIIHCLEGAMYDAVIAYGKKHFSDPDLSRQLRYMAMFGKNLAKIKYNEAEDAAKEHSEDTGC